MAISGYQNFMLPILKLHADNLEHKPQEIYNKVADILHLSEEDRSKRYETSGVLVYQDCGHWALTYLKNAGLLISEHRGCYKITPRGMDLLNTNPIDLTNKTLEQYEEFKTFLKRSHKSQDGDQIVINITNDHRTPNELIDEANQELTNQLATELLEKVKQMSPTFFEELVAKLLLAIGYGTSESDILQRRGGTGDGGIDGIIKLDTLGLDKVYIQAKRWASNVGKPEVDKFVGALFVLHATKGVFITTSDFTSAALESVNTIPNIILINGETLTNLMIEYNVGVQIRNTIHIKKIDENFFCED